MSEQDTITLKDGTVLRKKSIVSIEASERAYVKIYFDCREPLTIERYCLDDAIQYKAEIVEQVFYRV